MESNVPSPTFNVLEQSLLIKAGAGAGKTTNLISTFIEFCNKFEEAQKCLPNIVISTFTRKATQEIKERLLLKALEVGDQKLFMHINKKHAVHISTIHGLLMIFLSQNADLLSLPYEVRIVDDQVEKRFLRKIIKNEIKTNLHYCELLEHYRFEQLVEFIGKGIQFRREFEQAKPVTSDILLELTHLKISKGVQLLDLFFDFVGQDSSQWKLNLTEKGFDQWLTYFEYLKSVRTALRSKNIAEVLSLIDTKPRKPTFAKKNQPYPSEAHDILEEFIESLKFDHSDTQEYFLVHAEVNELFFKLLQTASDQLINEKKRSGEITINDLELFSLELTGFYPESILHFQKQWDYFMIDEFQDTSPLQVKILDRLIQNKPHFIVGDPQQSIYLFRGARSEVFFEKEKLTESEKSYISLKKLEVNYRSEPSLMQFINDYFTRLSPNFNQQFSPMQVRAQDKLTRSKVHFIESEDQLSSALEKVIDLAEAGISLKDICILSRKNKHLIALAQLAQRYHVPVQLQVATGFEQRREIMDLVSVLKFLYNPADNENLITLLRSPWCYLNDDDIYKLRQVGQALWIEIQKNKEYEKTYQKLRQLLKNYESIGVSNSLLEFVTQSGFLDVSNLYDSSGKREANFWKFFHQLQSAEQQSDFLLASFLSQQFESLNADLGSSAGEASPVIQPNRVNLMSIHASKGLQFPHVIVIGFSDMAQTTNHEYLSMDTETQFFSLSPFNNIESKNISSNWAVSNRKKFNEKELAEHQRFLYVALTRAQESLTLVSEKSKKFQNSWRHQGFWPEESSSDQEFFDIELKTSAAELQKKSRLQSEHRTIRSRWTEHLQNAETSTSVTEMLTSQQNQDLKLNAATNRSTFDIEMRNLLKAEQGTIAHRFFESMKYLTTDQLKSKLDSQQKELIEQLLQTTEIPFKQILENGHVEMGFGLKTPNGLLQGQIDLWGIVNSEIYLVDYKTGRSEYQSKAFEQMSIYIRCLQQMKLIAKDQPIHLVAWYVVENKLAKKSYKNFQDFLQQSGSK